MMRKIYTKLLTLSMLLCTSVMFGQSDLILTGVLDGPLSGGTPKGLEIYVINDIADLSVYGLANANNGNPSGGAPVWSFPAEGATAGQFIYLTGGDDAPFNEYLGFSANYTGVGALSVNGDDVIELYQDGAVVDVIGEIGVDGTGTAWEYLDGWAYRVAAAGPNPVFTISEWMFSGINATDGQATNATAPNPWPIGTYSLVEPSRLVLTGVLDGPLSGGTPKALEIYVTHDVADLSVYGLANANNGDPSPGAPVWSFPAVAATAGEYIYLTAGDDAPFSEYLEFSADYTQVGALAVNGDDAIELYQDGAVVDVIGEVGVDGTGMPWEYLDGWAYRVDATGPNPVFTISEWTFSGINATDGQTTNASAPNPWPLGTYSTEGDVTVMATISEIQETSDPSGDSPLVGQPVITSGIVTAVAGNGFWMQDGTGAWSGLFVRLDDSGMMVGDDVTVEAVVQENFGLTRLNDIVDITVNSAGNALPASTPITTADADTEPYESVLISVSLATCTNADLGFGEWQVNDGSGNVRVDDVFYDAGPVAFLGYDVTGIMTFSFDFFKILPRDAADVVLNPAADAFGLYFTTSTDNVNETDGTVLYDIEISSAQMGETTVEVAVVGGTAVNGENFNFTSPTTVTFADGDAAAQTISIEIVDDAFTNDNRTIELQLQNATNGAVFGTSMLTITILDDDTELEITDIAVAAATDADGAAINIGNEYTVDAIVYGVNMNASGLSFTLRDATGGMGVYSGPPLDDYVVTEGDNIQMTGTISQFNGLTQMNPTSIVLISQGNAIEEPIVVTELSEFSESNLVTLECVFITEPGEWDNEGSGFTVTISNGTDEFALRIDNDVDLYSMPPPEGTFDVTGLGGQFDSSSPFLEGYQLLPRYSADIVSAECNIDQPPSNDNCISAADVSDLMGGAVGEPQVSTIYTNVGATPGENVNADYYSCFGEPDGSASSPSLDSEVWFSFVGDGGTYLVETTNCDGTTDYIEDGDTQMFLLSGICNIAALEGCNEDGPNAVAGDYGAGLEISTVVGQTYLMAIDGYNAVQGEFCISMTQLPLANDECDGAVDLSSLVGGPVGEPQVMGTYTTIGASSVDDLQPDCWAGTPLTAQTVWFSFTGDGGMYFIETMDCGVNDYIDDGDTQMAIYTGDCGNLTEEACNEDGPQATGTEYPAGIDFQTVDGTEYYVMVDGYEESDGEFCMSMTLQDTDGLYETSQFDFEVYPNPASERFVIQSQTEIQDAVLTSIMGQKVAEWSFAPAQRVELNMENVATGVYILQVRSGNSIATSKLVVE